MIKNYYVIENDTITNIIVAEEEYAKEMGWVDLGYEANIGYVKNKNGIFKSINDSIEIEEISDDMIAELLSKL